MCVFMEATIYGEDEVRRDQNERTYYFHGRINSDAGDAFAQTLQARKHLLKGKYANQAQSGCIKKDDRIGRRVELEY